MAHRSKKKHLKHVHEHEPATPPAKSPVKKAEAAARGIAKKGNQRRAAEPKAKREANGPKRVPNGQKRPQKKVAKKGIVRRLAGRASDKLIHDLPSKLVATPRNIVTRARARVKARVKARVSRLKSMIGVEA